MSIQQTETSIHDNSFFEYALALHQIGFNVVPMKSESKAPALSTWKEYTKRKQTHEEVAAMSWGQNIGIVNGISDIRTIDIDGSNNADLLFQMFELLGLDMEYQWAVNSPGKGGGLHIHFVCPDSLTLTSAGVLVGDPLPEGPDFGQIELRWQDCVTMFPPSIHPVEKEPYQWLFGTPAMPLAIIPVEVVEKAFLSIASIQKKEKPAPRTLAPVKPPKYDAWSEKALNQELAFLRSATPGERNAYLNKSAFALGQIVGAGLIQESDVLEELARVATTIGLGEKEIDATLKSGIEAGKKKPRMPKQVYKDNEPKVKLSPAIPVVDQHLASFSFDDQGHAEAVHALYGPYIAYNESHGWMVWTGTHYEMSVQRINTLIVDVLRRRQKAAAHLELTELAKKSKAMAGTVAATRSLLENLCVVNVEEFDNEFHMINCLNGIVDLRTKTLIPHEPSYRFTWCSPVNYNPDASMEMWLDFISATVETPEMVDFLQQALGYSITGLTSEELLFYIFGPPRSGKGTLSEILLAIFPRPIAIEVDFNTFTANREGESQNFDLAPMKASRIVFASESNKYQSLNPAKVKALTGGNEINCAFKYGKHFSYRPQYTVWLSSNHEANADADDNALWGRINVIHFPYSQLGHEDKSLKQRLKSSSNLEGVLTWLVQGAYQWYQHEGKGLQTPEAVTELTSKHRDEQDTAKMWLEECCKREPDAWTENTKVRVSYENWCKDNGHEPKKAKGLSQSLSVHGLQVGILKWVETSQGKKQMRGIQGLTIL